MADFDLTQTDAQVQSILNDAQDAMGAGAQTTLTTDYVMLKDTNGRYHKILKDSLTEACRNVLSGLLVNNDKGTTISQIAAIASGDFGSITPANLASVLGASRRRAYGANIDEMITPYIHIYTVTAAETNECQGTFPKGSGTATEFNGAFDLEVKYVANRISQTMQDNGLGGIWWRYYNPTPQSWSVWYKVTTTPGSV